MELCKKSSRDLNELMNPHTNGKISEITYRHRITHMAIITGENRVRVAFALSLFIVLSPYSALGPNLSNNLRTANVSGTATNVIQIPIAATIGICAGDDAA